MKRPMAKTTGELKLYWRNYIFQSLLAGFVVFVVLLFLGLRDAVIIASIGSTAFIVFAMPKNITAKSRNVIGGYAVGLITGFLSTLVPQEVFLHSIIVYSSAVGLSIFIMVITNTEHPPAAGIALGISMRGLSLPVAIAVISSAVILSLSRYFFKKKLKNLT